MGGLLSGALAPAAGDQRVTGYDGPKLSYTKDGVPYVDTGPQCRAGKLGHKQARQHYDERDY